MQCKSILRRLDFYDKRRACYWVYVRMRQCEIIARNTISSHVIVISPIWQYFSFLCFLPVKGTLYRGKISFKLRRISFPAFIYAECKYLQISRTPLNSNSHTSLEQKMNPKSFLWCIFQIVNEAPRRIFVSAQTIMVCRTCPNKMDTANVACTTGNPPPPFSTMP